MICTAPQLQAAAPEWQDQFLAMMPTIETHARLMFRRLDPEARDDAVEEVIANACVAFARLVRQDKTDRAFPSALARFAVAQFRDGRRVGNRRNVRDVLSSYAQRRKRMQVERLDWFNETRGEWMEAVVEDHRTPVPDQVAFRCDFPVWLKNLSARNRQIAKALAVGHTTGDVAKRFRVTPGRVSQLRREMYQSWNEFQNETTDDAPTFPKDA
jgi:DNA-binding NarL/FixJ family response regulator